MSPYISGSLRQLVIIRGQYRCEYYLFPQAFAANAFDPETGILTPFFHRRRQRGQNHFELHDGEILPLTGEARNSENSQI